jgi:hypothetical protein
MAVAGVKVCSAVARLAAKSAQLILPVAIIAL